MKLPPVPFPPLLQAAVNNAPLTQETTRTLLMWLELSMGMPFAIDPPGSPLYWHMINVAAEMVMLRLARVQRTCLWPEPDGPSEIAQYVVAQYHWRIPPQMRQNLQEQNARRVSAMLIERAKSY